MHFQVSHWSACRLELRESWGAITARSGLPASPFLTWEFFDCVNQVRHNIEVVILRQSGRIIGCFPFQRRNGQIAIPPASLLNDLHGPLVADLAEDDFARILRAAGLSRFDFHASPCMPWNSCGKTTHQVSAYRAELGCRSGEYVRQLAAKRYTIRQQQRKTRAMERKLGPLRFEWRTCDEAVFEMLVAWKRRQYRATGLFDVFALRWTRDLLHRLLRSDANAMHGQLSALYAGNDLVAVHYGLHCGRLLHSWFPVYCPEHARFSPGTELFLRLAERGPEEGVTTLDFGGGAEPFKEKLTNQRYAVKCGTVDLVPWRKTLSVWGRSARQQAAKLPGSKAVKNVVRRVSSTLDPLRYQ